MFLVKVVLMVINLIVTAPFFLMGLLCGMPVSMFKAGLTAEESFRKKYSDSLKLKIDEIEAEQNLQRK